MFHAMITVEVGTMLIGLSIQLPALSLAGAERSNRCVNQKTRKATTSTIQYSKKAFEPVRAASDKRGFGKEILVTPLQQKIWYPGFNTAKPFWHHMSRIGLSRPATA